MKQSFSFGVFIYVVCASFIMFFDVSRVHSARLIDGVAQWNSMVGMVVSFTPQTALSAGDKITLTFPTEASVSSDFLFYAPGDEPVTVSNQGFVNFTRNATDNSVEITVYATAAAGQEITITLDSRVITGYASTNFAQQSIAVNTLTASNAPVDYGIAMITNDNTTEITATVPLFVTLAVDDVSMDLGTLSTASVATVNQMYTINSNNRNGVKIQITSDGGLRDGNGNVIDAVGDGEVTAGNEEYGIALDNFSGGVQPEALFGVGDNALPVSLTNIVGTTNPVSGGTFNINYKAAIDGTTVSGVYSQIVTVTIATNS